MSAFFVTLLVFAAATLLAYGSLRLAAHRDRVRRRFGALAIDGSPLETAHGQRPTLDPARLGLDPEAQRHLRVELMLAGYFNPSAVVTFSLVRISLLAALPLFGLAIGAATLPVFGLTEKAALAGVLLAVAYYLPRAWLSRRRRWLEGRYRLTFPDFLDMLVVCINAGLSLEAALQRATGELRRGDAEFRANLDLMAGEMRAGKSTGDALRALADRLSIREAGAFAGLLQQTLELGTDLTQALTVFSDEMRDRRMAMAEERAAALPPKLTLPLGLLIFPVVLIVVLAPAVMRIAHVVGP
ncbi:MULTISPECIES: type II secretion system F family protein [unclassified Methylobacterium]|uniref:type II secretion system F family protein n=1 Tax=unclassified Methylobacterium TaxID=2615210 RepID=UPI0011C838A3|nr:type II secretion system F family protein [Methylobacterium sp. WL64]TXM99877.1 type II secretion system F family protein [Methylobacterium sp. WL64]